MEETQTKVRAREREGDGLDQELLKQLGWATMPKLYLSRCPPLGVLEGTEGEHTGRRPLREHMEGRGWPSALVLCGHVHEGFGQMVMGATRFVNVAEGFVLVDWGDAGFKVVEQKQVTADVDVDRDD